ncbi:hypothetical protein N657DRAFT_566772 [Parathielavia appendiculata]|uniref:Uncharacterized protein n=1 Tax=Parathielavia appendiculata TaxID=2587402 RepID=A0AAN6Z7K1_9PEZI|nr:hypothetical protein N657DRAFT_566772 [Parathielavia appendiculata]
MSASTSSSRPFLGSSSSASSTTSSSSASSYSTSDPDLPSSNTTASGSSARHSMDSAIRPPVHVAVIRCLRCARAEEMTSTDDLSMSGMVQIGTNIYYCSRCAKLVGYT